MATKPIILYGHASGPNPWKVVIILEELSVPYEHKLLDFPDMKKEPYLSINPNGRVPAIVDPNTNITLWESGAIIDYLVDQYDKDAKLHYTSFPEKYLTRTWEHFQMSGQGPYFGQKAWFTFYHPEKIQSAIDRYAKEIERVIGVIELHLSRQGTEYLVGNKCTYADLMMIPWFSGLSWFAPDLDVSKFPKYNGWFGKLLERPAVKKMMADRAKLMGQK